MRFARSPTVVAGRRLASALLLALLVAARCGTSGAADPDTPAPSEIDGVDSTPEQVATDAVGTLDGIGEVATDAACEGSSRACAELAGSWVDGTAACRADGTGWDVQACVRADAQAEIVKPAARDPERFATARCNDGSPFTFRVSLSSTASRDWVISLRGGGLCDDQVLPCAIRNPSLRSTRPEDDRALVTPDEGDGGLFSRDPQKNPTFADANLVFGWYCSSDLWVGARTERRPCGGDPQQGWYFSGRHNVRAMLDTLVQRYGLDDADPATRVLFVGLSAGAIGAANNADQVAARLPLSAADGRVKVFVDAGWLVSDWDEPTARLGLAKVSDTEAVRRDYDWYGAGVNPLCVAAREAEGGHPGDCLFARHSVPRIWSPAPAGLGLPTFVQQSLEDATFSEYHGLLNKPELLAEYGARTLAEMEPAAPWRFTGALPYHDVSYWDDRVTIGQAPDRIYDLVTRFWNDGPPEAVEYRP